jgi:hypothetical protein
MFNQNRLSITEPCGLLLVSADYVFSDAHRDIGDVPEDSVIADLNLSTLHYEASNNRFTVSDVTAQSIPADLVITGAILYRQAQYEDDSRLVWYSADIDGFPHTTTGANVVLTFPSGVLVVAPIGYTAPNMASYEAMGASAFNAIIQNDVSNVLFNPNEFGTTVTYTHTNGTRTNYVVIKTATPDIITINELEISAIAQTIKVDNTKMKYVPRKGDKLIMEGVSYHVAGAQAENYTTDLYLQVTVGG